MKVWISPYKLKFKDSFKKKESRNGFLIKMQTNDFEAGYSDCFPWPEYGDKNVDELIQGLKSGRQTALTKKSLYFAKRDGEARANKFSLMKESSSIKNYKLVIHAGLINETWLKQSIDEGFSVFKIKMGLDFKQESEALKLFSQKNVMLRLDFNGSLTEEYFLLLSDYSGQIEYIEDPYLKSENWTQFQETFKIALAYDQPPFLLNEVKAQVQIIKPAKQELLLNTSASVVFTSYMDHPVGIAHAYWEALSYGEPKTEYGFMSHEVYEPTVFHEYIQSKGNQLKFTPGYGIGFDELWGGLEWMAL